TGTLTYGRPALSNQVTSPGVDPQRTLGLVASIERYSKHPLATAIISQADKLGVPTYPASQVHEPPGQGLQGEIDGHHLEITSRRKLLKIHPDVASLLPTAGGLECFVLIDGAFAAAYQFRDEPRSEGVSFIEHLKPKHQFERVMIVSGDRDSEVRYLAKQMGIETVFAEQSPEQKVEIVRAETAKARTMYAGDGINDAPALTSATVGIAIGNNSDVTNEASSIVILDRSLEKIDEFMHISHRMRNIALQCAVGGMALSIVAMIVASFGYITPVAGALIQEGIDVAAVLFALRAAFPPKNLVDFDS
ncbi:MAG TPA: HAD-IC family P-type ATPase, partial [Tepidisphaeraceae bacterium]|nr:HAD-IC family P-type ATPase [Tepidisphaeraceae bacterium]